MKINVQSVKDFIRNQTPESKIYFGADSERILVGDKWFVDYLLVIAIHINGKNGAKVFGQIERERDYDKKLDRPKLRLMTEVYKIAELYMQFEDFLEDRHVEIHLDLNPLSIHGSSCATSEAIGFIKGMCGKDPIVKPDSWCASVAADRLKGIF
jgi:uncharacterized protein